MEFGKTSKIKIVVRKSGHQLGKRQKIYDEALTKQIRMELALVYPGTPILTPQGMFVKFIQ